jgi:cobalt-precorrin-5B (C1)-methyltransferase
MATVSWNGEPGVKIEGGKGVGTVTKPGLEITVGKAAINPVPRRMIERSVREAAGNQLDGRGVQVTISVPAGEELAERTLNPRLGIVKGISILGTTGIVIPFSVNAYTACISQALDVAVACGCRQVVLTTGRRSEKFAQKELSLPGECFLQAGDFIGYSLEECARRHLAKAIVWGMIGKISKLATGHLYTNVSDSRVDIGFLARVAAGCGVPDEVLRILPEAVTASHFYKMLPAEYARNFCHELCRLAAGECWEGAGGKLEVECVMTSRDGVILGRAGAEG